MQKAILLLFIAILTALYFGIERGTPERHKQKITKATAKTVAPAIESSTSHEKTDIPSDPIFEYVVFEAAKIGQTDPQPSLTQQRIQNYVKHLATDDLKKIASLVHSEKVSADAQFFAAYLLAQSKDIGVLPMLAQVALRPITSEDSGKRTYTEQVVLRAQALEGFLNFKQDKKALESFDNTISKMENRFVLQQARRIRHKMQL